MKTVMTHDACASEFESQGFERIGGIHYNLAIALWWHPRLCIHASVLAVDDWHLLQSGKPYLLRSMAEEGETYARDLGLLEEYLVAHFPEAHLSLSSFRDPTLSLIQARIDARHTRHANACGPDGSAAMQQELDRLTGEADELQEAQQRDRALQRLDRNTSPLLREHLNRNLGDRSRKVEDLRRNARETRERLSAQGQLEREYRGKSNALCLLFTICSNIQIVRDADSVQDALSSVTKEIVDLDRFQVRQKLEGGSLRIYVEASPAPAVSLLTHATRTIMNPRQLERLGEAAQPVRDAVERQLMLVPREDIRVNGSVVDPKKLIASRIVQSFLQHLPKGTAARARGADPVPASAQPLWIGTIAEAGPRRGDPWVLPLDRSGHVYISGRSNAGKTFLGRVIAESAATLESVSVVVIDPSNQAVGLLCPEDRPEVLARYRRFGLKRSDAQAFPFTYHGLADSVGEPLPSDLGQLAHGYHIVSFTGLDDGSRCIRFAAIMDALFAACSVGEAESVRLVILIEEAHRFTRRGVDREAREAADRAELSLERHAREGRKYGIRLFISSQSIKDFSFSAAAIRQNVSTRVFMQNSDRELDYAADHIGDGRRILRLPRGEALFCNPDWEIAHVAVRPPLSMVRQPTEAEICRLVGGPTATSSSLSRQAMAALDAITGHVDATGGPVRWSKIVEELGVTGRRVRDRLVDELQGSGHVAFTRLKATGRPLVVTLARAETALKGRAETPSTQSID